LLASGLAAGAAAAWEGLLAPVKALAADVRPVRIKNIENFTIQLPATEMEIQAGVTARVGVTRIETDSGVRGYSFGGGGGGGGGRGGAGRGGAGAGAPGAAAGRG